MAWKKANKYDHDKHVENQEEAKKQLSGKDSGPKVRVQEGLNVFMIMPSINDDVAAAWRFAQVHYNPFHICGRADAAEDGEDFEKDSNFKNCVRCINTWNQYEAAGKPKDYSNPYKSKFSSDMSTTQFMIQVVNFTPFFQIKSGKPYAEPVKELVEKWMDDFIKVMGGEEPPEDMPEDMVEAAQAGPTVVLTKEDTGKAVKKVYKEEYFKNGEEDPIFCYDDMILQIVRAKDKTQKFEDKDGNIRYAWKDSASFAPLGKKKFWKVPEELFEVLDDLMVDLHNPKASEEELEAAEDDAERLGLRVSALERLTDEEIEQYLDSMNHSYHPTAAKEVAEDGVDDEFEDAGVDNLNDPDAFEDALDDDDMEALEELKEEVDVA